ncbi:hypothetical protein ACEPAH_2089 [Sanghuangporus vaninii]
MLKRPRDAFDTSPASSTPPERPGKAVKRFHIDSDAFSDVSTFHVPSDSPSNPFGRFRTHSPHNLPAPTPVSDHLVLRFQLDRQRHNVHRIVVVPANYTFWHLHRLTQFLFKWKDFRTERHPENKHCRIQRRIEHVFTVKKRIVFYAAGKSVGIFKDGMDVMRVAGNVKELKRMCFDDLPWEREECYTLADLWNKPSSSSNASRGIVYDFDIFSRRRATVHISLHDGADRIKASLDDNEELSNQPQVVIGSGLPDDDDDDEDFALDLQQFNEVNAFENFIRSQEEANEDEENDCPSIVRIAEEQKIAKQRMSASLPEHLPLDANKLPKASNPPTMSSFAPPPRPRHHRISTHGTRLPEAEESQEADGAVRELSPVKKGLEDSGVYLSDAEESVEDYNPKSIHRPQIAARKCTSSVPRLPDPEEYSENGDDYPKAPHKRSVSRAHHSDDIHDVRPTLRDYGGQAIARGVLRKRLPLQPRVSDPEESDEIDAAPRRRITSLVPRHPNAEDEIRARARHVIGSRRRVSMLPRLPDPDESREIGDDRPSKPVMRDRRASLPPLLGLLAAQDEDDEDPQEEEYIKAGPFRHKRRHAPLRGAPLRGKSAEPRVPVKTDQEEDDSEENDENAALVESEAEV